MCGLDLTMVSGKVGWVRRACLTCSNSGCTHNNISAVNLCLIIMFAVAVRTSEKDELFCSAHSKPTLFLLSASLILISQSTNIHSMPLCIH